MCQASSDAWLDSGGDIYLTYGRRWTAGRTDEIRS